MSRALSVVAAGVVAALTARQLGPSGRGVYVLLVTVAPFTMIICGLGVNLAARIHLVAPQNPMPLGHYFSLSFVLSLAQAAACLLTGLLLLPVTGATLTLGELAAFVVMGATLLLRNMWLDALNAYGFTARAAAQEAAAFVVQVGLVVALLATGADEVSPFIWAFTASSVVQIVLTTATLSRLAPLRPRWRRESAARLIRTGVPSIPSGLSQVLTFRVDRLIVGVIMGPAAVGIYSVAATVSELLRVLPMALSQSVFYQVASGKSGPGDFRRARTLCLLAGAVLGLAGFVAAPVAVRAVFGTEFEAAVLPLRVLLLAELAMVYFYVDGAVMGGLGRLGAAAKVAMVGLALVAVADVVLIPPFGLAGAAWASVMAYGAMGALMHRMLRKHRSLAPAAGPTGADAGGVA